MKFLAHFFIFLCTEKKIFVFSLRRQYPPVSLQQIQLFADTNRLDTTKPIDLTSLMNTGIVKVNPDWKHYGVQLTDEVSE